MMKLRETAAVPAAQLPRGELAEQLRLPGGFPTDGGLDGKLDSCLRAALSTVEARTGKALFQRAFRWQIGGWSGIDAQQIPLAPVQSLDAISLVMRDGQITELDALDYRIADDAHRPVLLPLSGVLPAVQQGGQIDMTLTAGYGPDWADIPGDLREAVLILGADYFDMPQTREAGLPGLPASVQALVEPYRNIGLRALR